MSSGKGETKRTSVSLFLRCGPPSITAYVSGPTSSSVFSLSRVWVHPWHILLALPSTSFQAGAMRLECGFGVAMPHSPLQEMRVSGPRTPCNSAGSTPRGSPQCPQAAAIGQAGKGVGAVTAVWEGAGHAGPVQPTLGPPCRALALHFTKMPKSPPSANYHGHE